MLYVLNRMIIYLILITCLIRSLKVSGNCNIGWNLVKQFLNACYISTHSLECNIVEKFQVNEIPSRTKPIQIGIEWRASVKIQLNLQPKTMLFMISDYWLLLLLLWIVILNGVCSFDVWCSMLKAWNTSSFNV